MKEKTRCSRVKKKPPIGDFLSIKKGDKTAFWPLSPHPKGISNTHPGYGSFIPNISLMYALWSSVEPATLLTSPESPSMANCSIA